MGGLIEFGWLVRLNSVGVGFGLVFAISGRLVFDLAADSFAAGTISHLRVTRLDVLVTHSHDGLGALGWGTI